MTSNIFFKIIQPETFQIKTMVVELLRATQFQIFNQTPWTDLKGKNQYPRKKGLEEKENRREKKADKPTGEKKRCDGERSPESPLIILKFILGSV